MNNRNKKTSEKKTPAMRAYHVRDSNGNGNGKGFWTPIGAAWAHDDGNGFNIQLDVVPIDGKVVLRTPKTEEEGA